MIWDVVQIIFGILLAGFIVWLVISGFVANARLRHERAAQAETPPSQQS